MEKEILEDKTVWLKCTSLEEAMFYWRDLEKNGYAYEATIYLGFLFKSEINYAYITYLDCYKKIKSRNDIISLDKKDVIYPDFKKSFLPLIGDLKQYFQGSCASENSILWQFLSKTKYRKVVIMVIDGLGVKQLETHLDKNAFLLRNLVTSLYAIYPSTTAAATTAIKSGTCPLENGWTGWENYIREINKDIILFTGNDYYTNQKTNCSGYTLMPYDYFFKELKVPGYVVEPDFTKEPNLEHNLERLFTVLKTNESSITYFYHTNPDLLLHEFGLNSLEVKREIIRINSSLENFAKNISSDTLLIITADHGHKDIISLDFAKYDFLEKYLERRPSNEGRCLAFNVKDVYKTEFVKEFERLFGNEFLLIETKEAIEKGYFGITKQVHERIPDFLGNYLALACGDFAFNYSKKYDFIFKSHHAGITASEMLVPLIIYGGKTNENSIT